MNDSVAPTVAEAILEYLVSQGIDTAFGVISIHNIALYDAAARHPRFRIVSARSEQGAVNMATGWARATGKLGVAITSTGTGAGNAAGALVEAWSGGTPLLHLTGQVASAYLDRNWGYIHEAKDQLGMLSAAGKAAWRLTDPETVYGLLAEATATAGHAPAGPVSIEIPVDLQSAPLRRAPRLSRLKAEVSAPHLDGLVEAVELLRSARRPILWVGSGAVAAGAFAEVARLWEWIQSPLLTSQSGRGIVSEDHPLCIGYFGSYPEVAEMLAEADLLVSVGTRFRTNEANPGRWPIPPAHLNIDADPKAACRPVGASLGLVGDIRAVLQALLAAIGSHKPSSEASWRERASAVRAAVRRRLVDTLGPYAEIAEALGAQLPEDAIVVRDVTVHTSSWASRLLPVRQPRTAIHAAGGGIGQGLAMAIGAQVAFPERTVVALVGDGGLLVDLGELSVVGDLGLPVVVILFDDRGYGVLRNIQDREYGGRHIGVDWRRVDFPAIAEAMGVGVLTVEQAGDFPPALARALSHRRPWMIYVDAIKVGPMRVPFGGPPGR